MKRWLPLALCLVLAVGPAASARAATIDLFGFKKVRALADAAWVIDTRSEAPLEGYVVIVCPSGRAVRRASKDGDLRAYVRHVSRARADLVVIVRPAEALAGPTFAVYFKRYKPVGYVELDAREGQPTEASVAAHYEVVSEAEPTSRAPIFEPGRLKLAAGGELEAFRFVGWGP
jgi:hypothetical protein